MFETPITVVGTVLDQPMLRRTPSGRPVTSFRISSVSQHRNPRTQELEPGARFVITVVCWQEIAEQVAGAVRRGDGLLVHGRIATREYVKDGQTRSTQELTADAVGHNLAERAGTDAGSVVAMAG